MMKNVKFVGNKSEKTMRMKEGRKMKKERFARRSRTRLARRLRRSVQRRAKDRCEDWWTQEDRPRQKLTYMSCITFLIEIGVIIASEVTGKA
jgi:hypothetical protein